MTNLEFIFGTIFLISVALNIGLVLYVRVAITRLLSISEEMYDFKEMVDALSTHLESVYELEMFYGDETLASLMEHSRKLKEALNSVDLLIEEEEEESREASE